MNLKHNLIANFFGSAWTALMTLAFIPFYIRMMGAEAYGIVGVYVSLQVVFSAFDLGLSQALTREMSRLSVHKTNMGRMADTARTLEIIYWGCALIITGIIFLLADYIAYNWLKPESLPREALLEALYIMAIIIGTRWPIALYLGGMNGLQQQVLVNIILATFATLQGVGAVVLLWLIEPTIQVFFLWHVVTGLVQVIVMKMAFWKSLAYDKKREFQKDVLKDVWRFAAGMTGISVTGIVITQIDKVLLSKLLSLTEFGYYTFAVNIAAITYKLSAPVFTAYYPKLTELVSKDDRVGLIGAYHQGSQLLAIMILPLSLTLAFFSTEVLELWVQDPKVVEHTALLFSLLLIGNTIIGIMNLPYALQLAYGWTRLVFYTHIVDLVILGPVIYFLALNWGGIGAAAAWIAFGMGHILIVVPIMHRRLLIAEKWSWYTNDVAKPLAVCLIVMALGKLVMLVDFGDILRTMVLAVILGLATFSVAMSITPFRNKILRLWRRTPAEIR